MKDLQYTQAAGFSEVDTPVDLAWSDQDDDETARAQRLGWEPYYATSDYCDSTWYGSPATRNGRPSRISILAIVGK